MTLEPIRLSLGVIAIAAPLFLLLGVGVALFLVRSRSRARPLIETVTLLPLVLPPSVLGYYLLLALGRGSPMSAWLGLELLFTWPAAVIAAVLVGLPLVIQAAKGAIGAVDPALEAAARTLGASEIGVLLRVTLPLARRGIAAGLILATARALGEFGATLMIAGNIPGRTQTMPLAIYNAVQNREYALANLMVLVLTAVSFAALWTVQRLGDPRRARARWEAP
jgi:molybdate transport system permease protein